MAKGHKCGPESGPSGYVYAIGGGDCCHELGCGGGDKAKAEGGGGAKAKGGGGGGNAKAEGGGGGGAGNKKVEDTQPQPHPVKEQLPGVQYCVKSPPPWLEAFALGFQHYVLTLGITVLIPTLLVPQMGGSDREKAIVIQTLLFVSGWSTLFQTLFGTRLPSVAVGSYAYIIPITSIVLTRQRHSYADPKERFADTMRAIQGALIIAGSFQMIMGFLGLWRNFVRFLSPLSVAPYVTFTGLGLYYLGFPMVAKCIEIGLPGMLIFVICSQYLPRIMQEKKPVYSRYALLFSVAFIWLFAEILTSSSLLNHSSTSTQINCRTDRSGLISAAPWVYVPHPFQWGSPTFNTGEAFAMLAASFISLFESTGTFFATARYASATPIPSSVVSRGSGWLGVGTLLSGGFGSLTGLTASVENAGLLALTKVGSRRVIQISAVFMIIFSIFGKFGAFFASIPFPIFAALSCVLFGYISAAGLGFLQFCNLNSFRTKFILGFTFFVGLSVPQYFREYLDPYSKCGRHHTGSCWFHDLVVVVFSSHTAIAAVVSLCLDFTLARDNDEAKDNGLKWWEKFSLYKSDARNDEFYGLPCMLNKMFPAI